MSITKFRPVTQQPQSEIIAHQPDTLDFTNTIIVNRERLAEAYSKARFAARRLSQIEGASELDIEAIDDLCRSLHRSTDVLAEMLNAKGGAER